MKQILVILILFLLTQTVQAQPMVVQEQKLNNGEIVRMCVFDNGSYGYCTPEDEYNAINAYQGSKQQTKIQKFNTGVNNTVNTINNLLDSIRVIGSYFGI
mgnify:FL=1